MTHLASSQPPLNLALDPWLPMRRRGGRLDTIAPWQVTDQLADDPVVEFAWPRADFDGASLEFMIGLLATTMAPLDDIDWRIFWNEPPAPETVRGKFEGVAQAFNFDGDGPRFMQDMDGLIDQDELSVAQLMIDAPGEQTLKKNADFFVKRGQIETLGRAAAAMALFTLQTYAPSGGAGHRTSLRGGGPMTTLAIGRHAKRPETTLWDRLWPNVETLDARDIDPDSADLAAIFPWLKTTQGSNPKANGGPVNAKKVSPLQVYWAMPRRIRLNFEAANDPRCDLTGQKDPVRVSSYRTRNYGMEYQSEGFSHPLSPYYSQKPGGPRLPLHPQPGGMSYRDWLGLVVSDDGKTQFPAAVISAVPRKRGASARDDFWRLVAFGYDMDNMKARGWLQSESYIPALSKNWTDKDLERVVNRLVLAAKVAANALVYQIKSALFKRAEDAPGDFGFVAERFWRDTEADFHHVLAALRATQEASPEVPDLQKLHYEEWAKLLRRSALALFDEQAPLDTSGHGDMERVIKARASLGFTFSGYGKSGKVFFNHLGLVLLETKKSRATAKEKT